MGKPAKKSKIAETDAITILIDDHKRVKAMFTEFKKFEALTDGGYDNLKQKLINAVYGELKMHAQVEAEIFYPAVRKALANQSNLLNQAQVEHILAKELIADIEFGCADDPMTYARFIVLGEYIEQHTLEEEIKMLPIVRRANLDLVLLGNKITARRQELKTKGGHHFGGSPYITDQVSAPTAILSDRLTYVSSAGANR